MRWCAIWLAAVACAGPPRSTEDSYPPVRLRLLTDSQHANAIRDLVGEVELPDVRTPGVTADQFVHPAGLYDIRGPLLSQYHTAARVAAEHAAANLGDLLSCSPAAIGDRECAGQLIDDFAPRAFRRPLNETDRDRLLELYDIGSADGFTGGIELVIEAILSSADFLYRKELGEPGGDGVVELTSFEIAAGLSFLFLDSIPDEPLWAAAVDGSLSRPEVIAGHVERLLDSPRVRDHLEEVVLTWLKIPNVRTLEKNIYDAPEFTDELRASMVAETTLFVTDVLWRRDGSLSELLTSPRTFVDGRLAAHYGVAGITGDDFVEVGLDPAQRAGVLTHAGILSLLAKSRIRSIIQRGLFINRVLVCYPEPPPPSLELLEEAQEKDAIRSLNEREFADYRAANPDCAGCHSRLDPLGIALEHYDNLGRWRPEAEATTAVTVGEELTEITGAVELVRLLAASEAVHDCVVDQYLEHAFGGVLAAPLSRAGLKRRFADSDLDLVDVFRAIANSAVFRKRTRELAP